MKKKILLLVLTVSWVAGSCRSVEAPPDTSVPNPTAMPQPTQPVEPAPTATVMSLPSSTAVPTETASGPSATPTVIGTIVALIEPTTFTSHLSPDGNWQAEVVRYDCVPVSDVEEQAYERLDLIQPADNSTVLADSQLQSCGGLGAFGLAGLFWSPNSRYFYYTNAREGFPDGLCGYWSPPFLRIDVTNPAPEFLGIGSLSKDETRLATWYQNELTVWDIDAGEIARMPPFSPGTEIGPVAWSPDSESLVYVQTETYCPVSGNSYVVRLDLSTSEQALLLESESPTFSNVSWESPDELTLVDENGDDWRYNLVTKELQGSP